MGKVIDYYEKMEMLTNKLRAVGMLDKREDKMMLKLYCWYAEHLRRERLD